MKMCTLALDIFERLVVLCLYGALVGRIVDAICSEGLGLGNLLLLPSEGMVLVFVLLRRRTNDVSLRPLDWLLAITATSAPMLVTANAGGALVPLAIGCVVIVTGTIIQVHAKVILGRSFGCIPANRGLKDGGPYRFVRHPMYAGYALSHFAFALMNPSLWNLALYGVCTLLQLPRLLAEERLLSRDEQYRRYRILVPYRMIPGVF